MAQVLSGFFGENAYVEINPDNTISVTIISGYNLVVDKLSDEELKAGVFGGGLHETLNGSKFKVSLTKAGK